jgi:glutaredoxin-related protein
MNFWKKLFPDQDIYGTDEDVKMKRASWRNSRSEGQIGVQLCHGWNLAIYGSGEYWQSDTLEAVFPESSIRYTARRIMKKVETHDRFWATLKTVHGFDVLFFPCVPENAEQYSEFSAIPPLWIGRWFVLELDLTQKPKRPHFYISGDKF